MLIDDDSPINFDQDNERKLLSYLTKLRSNDAVLSYFQLQGFLFAIACSPEQIKPSEWFDVIWLNDEPQFDQEEDARTFFRLLVSLSDYIASSVCQRRYLPFDSQYAVSFQAHLAEWGEGFLLGHQYLDDIWCLALEDLDDIAFDESVEAALSLAMTFSDIPAEQLVLESEFELKEGHLKEAYAMLWQVLAVYSRVGERWSAGVWEYDVEQLFLTLESVAREDSCPCGSGLVFSKCCLH
jgi:yecA family protein